MNVARLGEGDALIVVDVQRDFLPGGALAIPEGDAVILALRGEGYRIPGWDEDLSGQAIEILLSGNIDERRIEALLDASAPVDAFGVGTHLDVSADAPSLDMAYKLEEYAGRQQGSSATDS